MGKGRDCCVAELFDGMGCDMLPLTDGDESMGGKEPARLPDEIVKRLENGEIIEQKTWKFISVSSKRGRDSMASGSST